MQGIEINGAIVDEPQSIKFRDLDLEDRNVKRRKVRRLPSVDPKRTRKLQKAARKKNR